MRVFGYYEKQHKLYPLILFIKHSPMKMRRWVLLNLSAGTVRAERRPQITCKCSVRNATWKNQTFEDIMALWKSPPKSPQKRQRRSCKYARHIVKAVQAAEIALKNAVYERAEEAVEIGGRDDGGNGERWWRLMIFLGHIVYSSQNFVFFAVRCYNVD